jgi:hypothetical protein
VTKRQGDGTGYCIGTWDTDSQAFLPHPLHLRSWYGLTLWQLRTRMRELQEFGYTCHRFRDQDGGHYDNDTSVLIEATAGRTKSQVIIQWKRGHLIRGGTIGSAST